MVTASVRRVVVDGALLLIDASRRVEFEDAWLVAGIAALGAGAWETYGGGIGAMAAGGAALVVLVIRLVCAAWVTRAEVGRGDGRG